MRNFFILCAATALASAVSLSHVNDNEYTGLDVVGEDYDENEYDMQEESADEQDDWETSLAQKGFSLFKGLRKLGRKMPTPSRPRTSTVDGGAGAPEIGKPLRPRSFTGTNKISRGRANASVGAGKLNRSTSTTNLPDVNSIKITGPSVGGGAPLRKLNRSSSVDGGMPALNRQKGQFKPDGLDGDLPAPGPLKLRRQNAMVGLEGPKKGAPQLKRNRITGRPDTRGVNKTKMGQFEKAMHAMTAVEIVTTIAQMGNDIANHKELMAAMDKQDKAYAAAAEEQKAAEAEWQENYLAAQKVTDAEWQELEDQQADIDAATKRLAEEAAQTQAKIDAEAAENNAELQAEWDRIIAEQAQLEQDQADADTYREQLIAFNEQLNEAEVNFCTENPDADYCY